MTENLRPLAAWDSDDPVVKGVAWWSRLDGRYQVEVQYADSDGYRGTLVVFDHNDGDRVIHSEETPIAYAARFGPDMQDVERWQTRVLEVIDQYNSGAVV